MDTINRCIEKAKIQIIENEANRIYDNIAYHYHLIIYYVAYDNTESLAFEGHDLQSEICCGIIEAYTQHCDMVKILMRREG